VFVEIVLDALPDHLDRDDVEDALADAFAPDGEVTGAGVGMGHCHLDLEIEPGPDREQVLARVRGVLTELGIESNARLKLTE
jgi:hypothetical protein